MIIAFIGYARSGKDTAAHYLVEKYGYRHYNFSDVLINETEKRGLPDTKDNRSIVGTALRKESGDNGIVGKLLVQTIKSSNYDKVVLSGMRSPEELDYLRSQFDIVIAIYIDCPLNIRYDRRPNKETTKQEIVDRDERDKKNMGLGRLIEEQKYDHRVDNVETKDELYSKIDELINNF